MTSDLRMLLERLHGAVAVDAEAAARDVAAVASAASARVIAVSACLLGARTRYDGSACPATAASDLLADPATLVLPLCPELLGGMGCPRRPVHFATGDGDALATGAPARVVDDAGRDHTQALVRGARRADRLASLAGAGAALLKERSPSCGVRQVHGPAGPVPGRGAFAALLAQRHLPLASDEDVIQDPSTCRPTRTT